MTRLIDSILDGNYIQANELFEERMEQIAEKKLYEEKRRIASLNEGEYSAATQKALAGGKRLLTPQERKHGIGSDGSTRPATGIKKLAPKGTVIPRSIKDTGERYNKALERAKDLEARGSTGKIAAVKKAYRPYRAGKAVGTAIRKTAGVAKKAISGALGGLPDMMPEETTPRKVKVKTISRNISKSRESIAVRRKGDKSKVKLRIPKDKYNPRIHNLV